MCVSMICVRYLLPVPTLCLAFIVISVRPLTSVSINANLDRFAFRMRMTNGSNYRAVINLYDVTSQV